MLPGNTIVTTDTSLEAIKKNVRDKTIDEILRWCVDNSIVDYEEDFSDNGDCLIILSQLEKFLENLNTWQKEQEYLALDELIWKIYSDTGYYGQTEPLNSDCCMQQTVPSYSNVPGTYGATRIKGNPCYLTVFPHHLMSFLLQQFPPPLLRLTDVLRSLLPCRKLRCHILPEFRHIYPVQTLTCLLFSV